MGGDEAAAPPCHFPFKRRWNLDLNFMSGVALPGWLLFLSRHWRHIDWHLYWHRVLFLSVMAIINSLLGLLDWAVFGYRIAAQRLHPEPVFILGHPRTGTTHLHNLLATDPQFAYLTTFQAGAPQCFISLDPFKRLWAPLLAKTRPMDAMALTWQTPAEDEIVTSVLSGGVSPYMAIVLPRQEAQHFRDYYSFQSASRRELQRWENAFLWILRKVTLFWGGTKPLLIKSPVHTARVALMLRLFPAARFIYIHRNPLEVFQSAVHMADAYYPYCYLQWPSDEHMCEFILAQYELLYAQYMQERHLIPAGRLVELSFAELDADPISTMRKVYHTFGWSHFEQLRPRMERYTASLAGFKKNSHRELTPGALRVVQQRWGHSFGPWGYDLGGRAACERASPG